MERTGKLRAFFVGALALFCLGIAPMAAAASEGAAAQQSAHSAKATNRLYIVRLIEEPVVAYTGGIAGYAATKPGQGRKIDPNSPQVLRYAGYLDSRHNDVLSRVGGRKVYDYHYSFNGFAAELTPAQADALRSTAGVVSVEKDVTVEVNTSSTPTFLGLDAANGLWNQLGGKDNAGEDIIIGIIDSGIWPESPSFSDRTGTNGSGNQDGRLSYHQIPGWHGKCTPGEQFTASLCNQKLIGGQHFNASWGGDAAITEQRPWEFNSVRDYNGHGTHTSSTAGGNNGVATTGPATLFGPISGMAPRARIAMYKALWSTQDASTASGNTSDLVAAIDQAVADGVDVINYSISGTLTNFLDAVEVAYLYAANAGVFVAASAGNDGPTTSTVAHPGPWLTTVAAGTHNRSGNGSVTLGNNATYSGASLAAAAVSAPLIDATVAGLPGADPTAVRLCFTQGDNLSLLGVDAPVLDPAKVAGKIVVCDRGTNARVNKSLAVQDAGGAGMLLLNTSPNSLNADFHFVPTVHLQNTDRTAIKTYAATASPTATIAKATLTYNTPAPFIASFSSRGPLRAGGGDLLKPDLIAPGQDILAAVAPPGNHGLEFNLYSGTSMSSPHTAGLAALLKQQHPDWTPMMIKSALMTTGYDVLDGANNSPSVIFSQGAGHVQPNKAADPGLVFDAGWNDWLAFLCGTTTGVGPSTCNALSGLGYSLEPSNLNVASIAIGDLAGVQTVMRKVTNVGKSKATYTASSTGLAGITVAITPSSLTLNPGETGTFTVKFTRTTATLNTYAGGQLTWTDGTHNVRIPMVIRPVALAAPAQVSGSYNVTFGYDGPFSATPRGLIAATTFSGSVTTDPTGNFQPVASPYAVSFDVSIPAGTTYARFSLFDANATPGSDLDLYVYSGATLVGSSGGGTAAEEVNLVNPPAGTYKVWVHGFATSNPSTFTLFTWALGSTAAGNMSVTAPATATTGGTGTITLGFSGLTAGTKYLGSVAYSGVAGLPNPTIVRVDP
jgi:subtilisin family serine protease